MLSLMISLVMINIGMVLFQYFFLCKILSSYLIIGFNDSTIIGMEEVCDEEE